jgi:hypothetical protein
VSLDGGSNVTDPREWQLRKQFAPRTLTDDGIAIDRNKMQQEKADGRMLQRKEWASNVTN